MSGGAAPEIALAAGLFERLARETADPPGVTRASFGPGEAFAHRLAAETAAAMGLHVAHDLAGNQYMTWPGRDRAAPRVMLGSHMDSVNHGGNFDGAAGVIAALAAVQALRDEGFAPAQDLTVMAIRAEEMVWFPTNYCGSRMAFGLLPPEDYDAVRRSDDGRSLAEHMREEGFDPDALKAGARPLDPGSIRCFIEAHIEQGPVLEARGMPVGVVTGIRGARRFTDCRVTGRYAHAGAVPREARQDAVLAAAAFVARLEALWDGLEAEGRDFVATVGQFWTDPAMHGVTKIPGALRFTMDLRSLDDAVLTEVHAALTAEAARIGAERRVSIELGPCRHAPPAPMDPALQKALSDAAGACGVPALSMASGAGHDCATFCWQGVPGAMLFIRNQNGSHNPDEAMDMADFAAAVRVLTETLRRIA